MHPFPPTRIPRLALFALIAVLWCVAGSAAADWTTDDAGLAGARRCQSRSVLSSGILLGSVGMMIAHGPDGRAVGFTTFAAGIAATGAGLGLRVSLRRSPKAETPHERWPRRRCEARVLTIRGAIYLASVTAYLIRALLEEDDIRYKQEAWIAFAIVAIPAAAIGATFLGLGIRRLRRLGPRPAEEPPVAPLVEFPIGAGNVGIAWQPGHGRGGRAALSYTGAWP